MRPWALGVSHTAQTTRPEGTGPHSPLGGLSPHTAHGTGEAQVMGRWEVSVKNAGLGLVPSWPRALRSELALGFLTQA